jgi:hypothetical protein
MSIISEKSVLHLVTAGKHKGRICNIREYIFADTDLNHATIVVFTDYDCNDFVTIPLKHLDEIVIPGWEDDFPYTIQCKLHEYLESECGYCMIRDETVAQPVTLKEGDVLATGEVVMERPRRGFNSSILIHLSQNGWVELAARFPIALQGNTKFGVPNELKQNERLATGCLLVKNPEKTEKENWMKIFLDLDDCCINIPFCIPLALA